MIYLIPVYLIFSLIVTIRQKKDSSLLWFLLMPIGFSLALFGLILFTEYVSFANFIENPLLISSNLFIWKLNYYLDLSIFGMYRLMDVGIALYMLGAIGFPFLSTPAGGFCAREALLLPYRHCSSFLPIRGSFNTYSSPIRSFRECRRS